MQRLSDRSLQVLNGLLNHLDRVGQFTDVLHNDSQPTIKVSEAAQALAELLRLFDDNKPSEHLMGTGKLTTVADDVARIVKLEKGLSELALAVNRLTTETENRTAEALRVAYEAKAIALRGEKLAVDTDRMLAELIDTMRKALTTK